MMPSTTSTVLLLLSSMSFTGFYFKDKGRNGYFGLGKPRGKLDRKPDGWVSLIELKAAISGQDRSWCTLLIFVLFAVLVIVALFLYWRKRQVWQNRPLPPKMCCNGCGRKVRGGTDKSGKIFSTCCDRCGEGDAAGAHSLECDATLKRYKLFCKFDLNADGYISRSELTDVMKSWGHNLTEIELDDMFKSADRTADELIDYNELMVLSNALVQKDDSVKSELETLPDDNCSWAWGDLHARAYLNPFRWSQRKMLGTTICELQELSATSQARAVALHIGARKCAVKNVGEALTTLRATLASRILKFYLLDDLGECLKLWFGKSADTDVRIKAAFADDMKRALAGVYDSWAGEPESFIALLVLMDQFPRNLYRGTERAFRADAACRLIVRKAMAGNMMERLSPKQAVFPLLVLTHSEDLPDQKRCLDEWHKLKARISPKDELNVFEVIFAKHLEVIQRFGRFPHRNDVLGRETESREKDFLANGSFRFDLPVRVRDDGTFFFARDADACWRLALDTAMVA